VRTRIRVVVGGLLAALLLLVALPVTAATAASIVLRQGSRGSAVMVLQHDLRIPEDGDFGAQTRRAVITFQSRHHLSADGVVAARTWAALGGAPRVSTPVQSVRVRRPAPPVYAVSPSVETQAVLLAAAQRGKPYRWGAAGPNSFDCSGLVQYVYKRLGVALPRTTYAQYAAAVHIPRSQLRPGDLIFVDGLGHVGIYAGFGFIWHAPHTGDRVRLSLIWDRHYVVARVR
jgi:cell wall-associated NlpC family hydrolase